MAGIRVTKPVGDNWEYSLEAQTWQPDPVFSQQADGNPFVLGTIYTVYCRNEVDGLTSVDLIPFGKPSNDPEYGQTLDELTQAVPELLTQTELTAEGVSVIIDADQGPVFRHMAFEKLAQFVTDRMPVESLLVLFQRLFLNATDELMQAVVDRLIEVGYVGGGSTPTTLDALSRATPGLSQPLYESHGNAVVLLTAQGPVLRFQTYERLAEYVADRMPAPWQRILLEKLIATSPDALDQLSRATLELSNQTQYEAEGVSVVVNTPTGPVFRRMAYERLAEYVADRMPLPWQRALADKLTPLLDISQLTDAQVCALKVRMAALDCGAMPPAPVPVFSFGQHYRRVADAGTPVPIFSFGSHYQRVADQAPSLTPEVLTAAGIYDPDRGFIALATAKNGNNFDVALEGINGTAWADSVYHESERFAGNDDNGSYFRDYGYLPDGNYRETWSVAGGAQSKFHDFTVRHTYAGSVDVNNCNRPDDPSSSYLFTGWAVDLLHPARPVVVDVFKDGVWYAEQTCQGVRNDVRDDYLRPRGYNGPANIFDFRVVKGADALDGQPHTWEARVRGDNTRFTYIADPNTTCGNPPTPDPYVTDYQAEGDIAIGEGGAIGRYFVTEIMSAGPNRRYNSGAITQVDNLPGLTRTSVGNGSECTLQLAAGSISANQNVVLEFILGGGIRRSITVQLINADDTRPTGLTTYRASFNFTRNNATRKYTSLSDANNTACKHFAGIEAGNLNLFTFQAGNLSVGTICYLGDTTNTAVLSDEIYYVCDASNGNTILKAIQVAGGKIVAVEVNPNQCATPPPANRPPVREVQSQFLTGQLNTETAQIFPTNHFSDPDNDPLSWSLLYSADGGSTFSGLPAWTTFDAARRLWSYKPPTEWAVASTQTRHRFRKQVSDGRGGTAVDDFNLLVGTLRGDEVPYIQKIQTKRTPGQTNQNGILIRVQAIGNAVPRFAYTKGDRVPNLSEAQNMPAFTDGPYQYSAVISDPPNSGTELILVGPLDDSSRTTVITIENKEGTDADWVTQYERN